MSTKIAQFREKWGTRGVSLILAQAATLLDEHGPGVETEVAMELRAIARELREALEDTLKPTSDPKPLTCDKCGHENEFLAPECAGERCRGPSPSCKGYYRKVG